MTNNQNETDTAAQRQAIVDSIRAALNREDVWEAIMKMLCNALCEELEQVGAQPDGSVGGL